MTLWFLAVGGSALSLAWLPYPYIWVFFMWLIIFFTNAVRASRRRTKIIAVNGLLVAAILLLLESVLWIEPDLGRERPEMQDAVLLGDAARGFRIPDKVLGYRPRPDVSGEAVKMWKDEELYRAIYSIDANRLRVTPPPRNPDAPAVLFFGCSYAYGEGVHDQETTPYRVAVKSDYAYHVFNFAFGGYGPHHMLAALESGIVDEAVGGTEPEIIVYQGVDFHADRSAGRSFWDQSGPWYVLDEQDVVRRMGSFEDKNRLTPIRNNIKALVEKSSIAVRLLPLKNSYKVTAEDIDLMVGIIEKSRDVSKVKYPNSDFHVIFWDEYSKHAPIIIQKLRDAGVAVHVVSEFAPEINRHSDIYRIPKDWHPTAKAHDLIAAFVVDQLLSK